MHVTFILAIAAYSTTALPVWKE